MGGGGCSGGGGGGGGDGSATSKTHLWDVSLVRLGDEKCKNGGEVGGDNFPTTTTISHYHGNSTLENYHGTMDKQTYLSNVALVRFREREGEVGGRVATPLPRYNTSTALLLIKKRASRMLPS